MFNFHSDKIRYFEMTKQVTQEHIVPFVAPYLKDGNLRILEVGCGEGGVLKAFCEMGHQCMGIELSPSRAKKASELMKEEIDSGKLVIVSRDIYDIDVETDIPAKFDLIILKDVIEHIFDQEKIIPRLTDFLNPNGHIFFAFPPWHMPFGGHQQICKSKWLSKLPYYHLLPWFLYRGILKLGGESDKTIQDLKDIKQTGISIERFERIIRKSNLKIAQRKMYLFNPIYQHKFGLKPRAQFKLIELIPYLRNFLTTGVYYMVEV